MLCSYYLIVACVLAAIINILRIVDRKNEEDMIFYFRSNIRTKWIKFLDRFLFLLCAASLFLWCCANFENPSIWAYAVFLITSIVATYVLMLIELASVALLIILILSLIVFMVKKEIEQI